jgi:hypothetical protein
MAHHHTATCGCGKRARLNKAVGDEGLFGPELEQVFARTLIDAIKELRRNVGSAEVNAMIRQSVEQAIVALDAVFALTDVAGIVNLMTQEIMKAGLSQAAELPASTGIQYRFDVSDPRAIAWARNRAGQLISNITDEVRVKVGDITARLLDGEITIRQARNEIARNVGLHDRWQKAVDNSYDSSLQELLDQGYDLDQAEQMAQDIADAYSQRLINTRAMNIARTELATAQNQGRYLGWQQSAEAGMFNPATTVKEWRTAPEFVSSKTEVCPICEPLDGMQAPVFEEFPEVNILMPPAHPNCRCRAVLIPQSMDDVISQVEEARIRYGY